MSIRHYDWKFVSEKEYLTYILVNRKSRAERNWKEERQRGRKRKKQVSSSGFTNGRNPTGLKWK